MRTRIARLAVIAGVTTAATLSLIAGTASASTRSSSSSSMGVGWYQTKTQCEGGAAYFLRHGYDWYICSYYGSHEPEPWYLAVGEY